MKMNVETVIEGSQREGVAWGMGEDGSAVLVVVVGSRRVLVAMSVDDCLETAIGAAFVGQTLRINAQMKAGAPPPARALVDASGVPLGKGA